MSTSTFGKCVDFGLCPKADSQQPIPIAAGEANPVCPDCGKLLRVGERATRRPPFALIGIVAVLLLVGLGFALMHFLTSASTPHVATPSTIPVSPVAATTPVTATGIPSTTPSRPPTVAALTLCGSNTIGSKLGPELVRTFVADELGGRDVHVDHGSQADETVVRAKVPSRPGFHVDVAAHGSATAFKGFGAGAGSCQVGMASRRIKPEEVRALHVLGDLTGLASEHVLGLDGIAVIVHASNPVDHLGIYQLHGLFTGALTNWAQVGGNSGPVNIYARDDKSGTYDTFATLVLGKQHLTPFARRFEDSTTLSNNVARDPHGIGFIGLPYVNRAKALEIASGTAQAIYPNSLTVGRETYPLTRRLYLYTYTAAYPVLVGRFIAFAQSDAGQRIVNRIGFVGTLAAPPLRSRTVAIPADAPPAYANLLRTADEVDFAVYFKADSDILDNKAHTDVGRLVSLMSTDGYRTRKLLLAGFADSTGDPEYSRFLSKGRAHSVAAELTSQGLTVAQTFGFGQAVPIRDNATLDGQEKNRRVEIFIAR
jgi:phosphate transport system substrate-binding protein